MDWYGEPGSPTSSTLSFRCGTFSPRRSTHLANRHRRRSHERAREPTAPPSLSGRDPESFNARDFADDRFSGHPTRVLLLGLTLHLVSISFAGVNRYLDATILRSALLSVIRLDGL